MSVSQLCETTVKGWKGWEFGALLMIMMFMDFGAARQFQVAGSEAGTCTLANASVTCWGRGGIYIASFYAEFSGTFQLHISTVFGTNGNGATNALYEPPSHPVDLGTSFEATFIDCGYGHCCALSRDLGSKCWGSNGYGQLGQGDTIYTGDQDGEMGNNLRTIDLGSDFIINGISCGGYHTCASSTDHQIKCFGYNKYGQLGYEHTDNIGDQQNEMGDDLRAVDLGPDFEPIQVECGTISSCAISVNFQVKCWGYNVNGQLGQGDSVTRGASTDTMGEHLAVINLGVNFTVADIHCGAYHVCALSTSRDIKCWGSGSDGQLGLGDSENRGDDIHEMGDNLSLVNLGAEFIPQILATGDYHTLAVSVDGSLKAWGWNSYGQLGYGDVNSRGDHLHEMGDYLPVVHLGSGMSVIALSDSSQSRHTCTLLTNDSLFFGMKCFGRNEYGQLGVVTQSAIVGDQTGEMGDDLPFVLVVGFIVNPTLNPTTQSPTTSSPTTYSPTRDPLSIPLIVPSAQPTDDPTGEPTADPTGEPTSDPLTNPPVPASTDTTVGTSLNDFLQILPIFAAVSAGIGCLLIICGTVFWERRISNRKLRKNQVVELQNVRSQTLGNHLEMSNGLIVHFPIGIYDENQTKSITDSLLLDVDDVIKDVRQFADDFGYQYMSMNDKTYWTEQEILSFLRDDVGTEFFDKNNKPKYDGLIIGITSCGDEENVLTSDRQIMDKVAIHRIISNKYAAIRDFPRIFLFDTCGVSAPLEMTSKVIEQNAVSGIVSDEGTAQHVVAAVSEELDGCNMQSDEMKEEEIGKNTDFEDVRQVNEWTSTTKNPDYNLVNINAVALNDSSAPNVIHYFTDRVRQNTGNREGFGLTVVMDRVQLDLRRKGGVRFASVLNNKTRTMLIQKKRNR